MSWYKLAEIAESGLTMYTGELRERTDKLGLRCFVVVVGGGDARGSSQIYIRQNSPAGLRCRFHNNIIRLQYISVHVDDI